MIIKDWKRFFFSMHYFLKLIFIAKDYDVVFVSSETFNRGKGGENLFFKPMIEFCKKNNIKYIIFEDSYFKSFGKFDKNDDAIPLDLVSVIQIIFRKFYNLFYKKPITIDQIYFRELRISKAVKRLFFKKFHSKAYITLIWNNVTLWRCIDNSACIVDYQHGIICNGHDGYIKENKAPAVKSANNIITLVYGDWFKHTLIENDKLGFYSEENVVTVGFGKKNFNASKGISVKNKKILFSLQLTPDFENEVNEKYVEIVKEMIEVNADFLVKNNYEIIFKHHQRYSIYHCPDIKIEHDFISFDNITPMSDLLNKVNIHMTFHSTAAFDAARMGIPTIFIDMHKHLSPNEIFLKQYDYPCKDLVVKDYKDLKYLLINLDNNSLYKNSCNHVHRWSKDFYHDFDELAFSDFLLDKIHTNKNN